jgi:hypothetical protein
MVRWQAVMDRRGKESKILGNSHVYNLNKKYV